MKYTYSNGTHQETGKYKYFEIENITEDQHIMILEYKFDQAILF